MSAESALSLSIKDSEVTLSFIADASSPASIPGGHIVPVVLLHPDALDPEVEIATPLPEVHVYILINKQH